MRCASCVPGHTSGTTEARKGELPTKQFGDTQAPVGRKLKGKAIRKAAKAVFYSLLRAVSPRKTGVLRGWRAYGAKLHPGRHPLSVSLPTFCTSRK